MSYVAGTPSNRSNRFRVPGRIPADRKARNPLSKRAASPSSGLLHSVKSLFGLVFEEGANTHVESFRPVIFDSWHINVAMVQTDEFAPVQR